MTAVFIVIILMSFSITSFAIAVSTTKEDVKFRKKNGQYYEWQFVSVTNKLTSKPITFLINSSTNQICNLYTENKS